MMTFVSVPVVLGSQAGAVATGWAPEVPLLTVGGAAAAPLAAGLAGLALILLLSWRSSRGRAPSEGAAPGSGFREAA
jgi:hypothetical protein